MKLVHLSLALAAVAAPAFSQSFTGRWDLTIQTAKERYPSWMEVDGNGGVRVVGRVASVHPAKEAKLEGSHLSFTTEEWFGKTIPVTWEFQVVGKKLNGTQKRSDGVTGRIM